MDARLDSRYRLKNLILYIASRMQDARFFGTTKLNKVLYRSEIGAFRELGNLLTGYHYQKNQQGPTLRAFQPITAEMEQEKQITWRQSPRGRHSERRLVPLVEPDMSVFLPGEVKIIDCEIRRAWDLTAGQMSDEEHRTAAWFATRSGDDIHPQLCFVEDPDRMIPLGDEERERAEASVERFFARTRA